MIKRCILLFVLTLFGWSAFGQVGLTGGYRSNQASEWILEDELSRSEVEVLANGWSAGLDYWFRLKNYRMEFLPELNFGRYTATPTTRLTTEANAYSFFLNTHFYVFDWAGDCDCPTFSKQGNTLEKGFFLSLSPGVTWWQQAYEVEEERFESDSWAFSIGGGAGFDIGVSDLITVTPWVEGRYYPSVQWEGLQGVDAQGGGLELKGEGGNLWQLSAGLRLGFRFDYR